jgi:hypothetical protein
LETNGTLRVASSNIPENIIFDPRASCFSIALRYTTLAVVVTYLSGISSDNVTSAILGSWKVVEVCLDQDSCLPLSLFAGRQNPFPVSQPSYYY